MSDHYRGPALSETPDAAEEKNCDLRVRSDITRQCNCIDDTAWTNERQLQTSYQRTHTPVHTMTAPRNRSTRAFTQIEEPSLLQQLAALPPPASPSTAPAAAPSPVPPPAPRSASGTGTGAAAGGIVQAKTVEIRRLVSPTRSPTAAPAKTPPVAPPPLSVASSFVSGKPPVFARGINSPENVTRSRSRTRENAASASSNNGSSSTNSTPPRRDTTEWRETASRLSQRVLELEAENRLLKSGSRPPSLSLIEPPRTFSGGEMSAMLHAAKAAEAEDAMLKNANNGSGFASAPPSTSNSAARGQIAKSKSYTSGFGYSGLTVAEAVAASHRARSRKSAAAAKPAEKLRAGYWNGANNVKSSFSCNNLTDMERRDQPLESLTTESLSATTVASRASTGTLNGVAQVPPPLLLTKQQPPVLEKANSTNTRGATRGQRDAAALMNSFGAAARASGSFHAASPSSTESSSAATASHLDNDFDTTHRLQRAIATSFHAPEATLRHDSSSFRSVVDTSVDDDDDDDDNGDDFDARRRDVFRQSDLRVTSPRSLQEASLRSTGSLVAPPSRHTAAASKRSGATAAAAAGSAKRASSSDVRMWVGTWNMGAADPFADGNGIIDEQRSAVMLQHLLPHGYALYVLGVQEGVSENVYHAVEAYLNRNALGARYYRLELRNSNFALTNKHHPLDAVIDAVHGRGDGAFVGTKFTGLAVFVAAAVQQAVTLVRAGVHKFSVTSGSKGGVAVALRVHHTTLVFVNCHLDARNDTYRREQVRTLNAALGKVMGHYAFDLTEQFHHVVWMGDMNYRIVHLDPQMVLHMLADGRNLELHDKFDGLLNDRRATGIFDGFTEPHKFPDFYPTYKKLPRRGVVNEARAAWPTLVYRVLYKEPFYKGGKVKKRVPGWCDRILVHSLLVSDSKLLPEKVESPFEHYDDGDDDRDGSRRPPQWIDNYRSVNHGEGMDVSDHSPVFATFVLSFPGLTRPATGAVGTGDGVGASSRGGTGTGALRRTTRAHSTLCDGRATLEFEHQQNQQNQNQQQQQPSFGASAVTGSYFDQPRVVRQVHSVRPVSTVLIVSNMQLYWHDKALVPKKTRVVAPLVGEDRKQCDVIGERALETAAAPGAAAERSLSLNALLQHSRPLEQLHMLVWVKSDAIVGHCTLSLKRIARQSEGGDVRFRVPLYNHSMRLYHEGHPLLLAFSVRSKTFAK